MKATWPQGKIQAGKELIWKNQRCVSVSGLFNCKHLHSLDQ